MKSFSQRKGIKPVAEVAQIGAMNDELRNSLWNALDAAFWSTDGFVYGRHGGYGDIEDFSRVLWAHYFKKAVDSRPGYGHQNRGRQILDRIREYFFNCEWNEVYDLLEFVVRVHSKEKPRLPDFLNQVLARELAGYKFIDGMLVEPDVSGGVLRRGSASYCNLVPLGPGSIEGEHDEQRTGGT